jgi:hypothetical protein
MRQRGSHGAGVFGVGLEGGVGDLFCSVHIAFEQLHLGEVYAFLRLAGGADDALSRVVFIGEEVTCSAVWSSRCTSNTVDHLADVFGS